jgi:hypothetical protein
MATQQQHFSCQDKDVVWQVTVRRSWRPAAFARVTLKAWYILERLY